MVFPLFDHNSDLSFLAMPNEYGMDLAPNTASSIAVQMNEIKRKPKPYTSKCIDNWEEADYPVPKSTNYSLVVPIRVVS